MIFTLGVMHLNQHGQSDLLYLVLGVLTSLWGTVFFRNELDIMRNYTEGKKSSDNACGMQKYEGTAGSAGKVSRERVAGQQE